MTEVEGYKLGRYTIGPGSAVKVVPSSPGKRDGFDAVVRSIREAADGTIEVTVVGGRPRRGRHVRTYPVDRIKYRRQPKDDG